MLMHEIIREVWAGGGLTRKSGAFRGGLVSLFADVHILAVLLVQTRVTLLVALLHAVLVLWATDTSAVVRRADVERAALLISSRTTSGLGVKRPAVLRRLDSVSTEAFVGGLGDITLSTYGAGKGCERNNEEGRERMMH